MDRLHDSITTIQQDISVEVLEPDTEDQLLDHETDTENAQWAKRVASSNKFKVIIITAVACAVSLVICFTAEDASTVTYGLIGVAIGVVLISIAVFCRCDDLGLMCRMLCSNEETGDDGDDEKSLDAVINDSSTSGSADGRVIHARDNEGGQGATE